MKGCASLPSLPACLEMKTCLQLLCLSPCAENQLGKAVSVGHTGMPVPGRENGAGNKVRQ